MNNEVKLQAVYPPKCLVSCHTEFNHSFHTSEKIFLNEENDIDSKHPYNSALDAYHLTSKLGLKNATRLNIYELIKNHDWLKEYATGKLNAKDIAFELRQGNSFQMASILTASDLKAIKKNNQFYFKHRDIFKKATNEIC